MKNSTRHGNDYQEPKHIYEMAIGHIHNPRHCISHHAHRFWWPCNRFYRRLFRIYGSILLCICPILQKSDTNHTPPTIHILHFFHDTCNPVGGTTLLFPPATNRSLNRTSHFHNPKNNESYFIHGIRFYFITKDTAGHFFTYQAPHKKRTGRVCTHALLCYTDCLRITQLLLQTEFLPKLPCATWWLQCSYQLP